MGGKTVAKKPMLTVIADDITGAAELAGTAYRYGCDTRLVILPIDDVPSCDVLVVATDTRSMDKTGAMAVTESLARQLKGCCRLFKKTDSALRGHVMAELLTLIRTAGYARSLYIPANPSKQRIVREGVYYINGTPIDQTGFARDPEFPAVSASLEARMPGIRPWNGNHGDGVFYADAVTTHDIEKIVGSVDDTVLLAGAADLFEAVLRKYGRRAVAGGETPVVRLASDALILQGSTLSKPLPEAFPVSVMPASVYQGTQGAAVWYDAAAVKYAKEKAVVLTMRGLTGRSDRHSAVYLRETMASVAVGLIRLRCPAELIVEGGATAACLLAKLGWRRFQITQEIAPGVVRMLAESGTHVTMKPGSYNWGGLFADSIGSKV